MAAVECAFNIGNTVVSIVSIIAGGSIGYLSARRIAKFNARATASAKFRAAFAPALATISFGLKIGRNGERITKSFFEEAILSQASAIEEFRPFVNESIAYEEAWNEYKKIIAETSIYDGGAGWDTGIIGMIDNPGKTVEYLPLIKEKIEHLISYSENA
jgi:hypothetical protein